MLKNEAHLSETDLKDTLNKYSDEADRILNNPEETETLLGKARELLNKSKKLPLIGNLVDDTTTTIELISDYVNGTYRQVPVRVIVSALAAIIYLVSPIDLVPDVIPFAGFLDDAAVLTFVLGTGLSLELKKYKQFKLNIKKNILINDIKKQIVKAVGNERLAAVFITDDNNLKLLLTEYPQAFEMPIEVRPVILDIPYLNLRKICDRLNLTISDVIEEASCKVREKIINGEPIKVCRESDFEEFDEFFEILSEEE